MYLQLVSVNVESFLYMEVIYNHLTSGVKVQCNLDFMLSIIFSFLHLSEHTLCNNFKQAVGPGVLQTFSTCAVKS